MSHAKWLSSQELAEEPRRERSTAKETRLMVATKKAMLPRPVPVVTSAKRNGRAPTKGFAPPRRGATGGGAWKAVATCAASALAFCLPMMFHPFAPFWPPQYEGTAGDV